MQSEILSVLGMLTATVAILGLTYWFTKHVVGRSLADRRGSERGKNLGVLGQLALGRGQRLVVVRLEQRCLLLGITAEQISLLAELTEEEAVAWMDQGQNHAEPSEKLGSFLETLRNTMSQKK